MTPEYAKTARNTLLLSSAPQTIVDFLLARATVSEVARGATIFSQDDPADGIYIVLEGWVKLYRISAAGAEAVVGVFTKGHSFGEAVALRGGVYPVFAETVTDATLLRIDAKSFLAYLESSPGIAISMLTATYAHLHSLIAQIEQLKAQTGPQRVAEFLLELTQTAVGPCSVNLPYDKVLIAGCLGMKPESLSRAFAKLKEQGVTMHQTSAEIADVDVLRGFARRDRAVAWQTG
ncbi:MAG TPA: cyclic nucleotide-binding protein [Rhodobacteraceae bacterium]|nr:cyclic nucleotide-binding protein [Paracoccaceae bacterium]